MVGWVFLPSFATQKPPEEMTDFERALANMEYDDDHTPAQLAAEAKARGNKAFGLGKEYHPNALRYWKVSRHTTPCLS